MANTTYESLLPEILPMVIGCPDNLIINSIRRAVIELCEKAGVYQKELDPINTVSGTYEYDLEPPTGTVVHKILWVTHKGEALEPLTTSLFEERQPKWRDDSGTTKYFVKQGQQFVWLVPVPDTTLTSSTILRAELRPKDTSTACDSEVMSDYRDQILNGTLFRLLRVPGRDWTDFASAQVYASLFQEGLIYAERRARSADTPIGRKVIYGGLYSRKATGKYTSRRLF